MRLKLVVDLAEPAQPSDVVWATDEELAAMSDAEIVALLHEDMTAVFDEAKIEVKR